MTARGGWSIPEHLIISGILIWLPVKSLMRFRAVCKAWDSEISNHRFIELHRELSQSNICKLTGSIDLTSSGPDASSIRVERLTEEGDLHCYYRLPWLQDYGVINSSRHLIVVKHKYGYMLSNPAMRDLLYLNS
ncbi:hypothetical protein ACP70R_026276 [Stipagrostis hirtigluma subsp. patula]